MSSAEPAVLVVLCGLMTVPWRPARQFAAPLVGAFVPMAALVACVVLHVDGVVLHPRLNALFALAEGVGDAVVDRRCRGSGRLCRRGCVRHPEPQRSSCPDMATIGGDATYRLIRVRTGHFFRH